MPQGPGRDHLTARSPGGSPAFVWTWVWKVLSQSGDSAQPRTRTGQEASPWRLGWACGCGRAACVAGSPEAGGRLPVGRAHSRSLSAAGQRRPQSSQLPYFFHVPDGGRCVKAECVRVGVTAALTFWLAVVTAWPSRSFGSPSLHSD